MKPEVVTPRTVASERLSLERIAAARSVIEPPFLDTPQFEAASLGTALGCRLIVKAETFNPIGSFKARGAHCLASQLPAGTALVCASSGNFGQGLAHAARRFGLAITVFTSEGANPLKVARMRELGATVRIEGADPDATQRACEAFAAESGARLIEDGNEPAIAEGAGTIGIELLRWPEPIDAVLLPLGDGALLGGVARWIKAHSPATRMIGVCAAGAPAMLRSWQRGDVVSDAVQSIAEGIAIQTPYRAAVLDLVALVDDIVLVEDEALIAALVLAHRELGVVLEPSGAAGIAALQVHGAAFRGQRVATVLTGGNLSEEQRRRWLAG